MNNQPSFDRGLLVPIGVGIFSLMGICVILVMGRLNASRAIVEEVPSATPFQYSLIGTEPAIAVSTMEGVTEFPVTASPAFGVPETLVVLPTDTTAPVVPIITLPPITSVNTSTPTSASTGAFGPGTYDDIHAGFIYSGDWVTVPGVAGSEYYRSSLHVSSTVGNSVTFRFIGQELHIFYQPGSSLGTIRVTLDGTAQERSQSVLDDEWVLQTTSSGTHTVTITHLSGGSVNFNYIIVPYLGATPVPPTSTSTTNPNQ
jgi:hypothetical protein